MLWCSAYQTRRYPDRSAARASSTLARKLSRAVDPDGMGARSRIEIAGVAMAGKLPVALCREGVRLGTPVDVQQEPFVGMVHHPGEAGHGGQRGVHVVAVVAAALPVPEVH